MMTDTKEITNSADIIDVRDMIARVEALEDTTDEDEQSELSLLTSVLEDLKGCGGDEQWRDDWYPIILVRDSYFEDHAREEADSLGLLPRDAGWPATCIDWKRAAGELQQDYTTVEFDGVTYWYR